MRRSRLLNALGAAILVAGAAGTVLAFSQSAQAATGSPLPAHVFAPYFEAYRGDSLSGLASQSGNKYLTMAFLQTASRGSCTAYWNGDAGMPIAVALPLLAPETPTAVFVGPEGGFTDAELDAFGKLPIVTRVGLGPRVLRAETAALAALAVFQAIAGDWRRVRPR